jgi:hypothetical protein
MRIVYYIGCPGVGKSTLMRGILDEYSKVEEPEWVKEGMVTYYKFVKQRVIVLGKYDERTFSGTDTWSKAAGVQFRQWLIDNREKYADWGCFGEGERLSNKPNMDAMFEEESMKLVCLKVSEEELERRRAARNNTQNESWMKGMKTRIANLCKQYPHKVEVIG